jgi:thiol-disulfide isomerase/thioredoxin
MIFMHKRIVGVHGIVKLFVALAIGAIVLLIGAPQVALAAGAPDDALSASLIITPTPTHLSGGCTIGETKCTTMTAEEGTRTPETIDMGSPVFLPAASGANAKAVIYFFWGDGCPHCAKEKPFLQELAQRYPDVAVREYEVWYNEENRALLAKMGEAYGFEPNGVPVTFVGDQHWIGYTDSIGQEIEKAVNTCLAGVCKDAGAGIITPAQPTTGSDNPGVVTSGTLTQMPASVDLPLIGTVDLQHQSLLLSTLLISFVDGFNPCSIWVLTMLLAITLHTGSRKKVLVIGLIYLTVTAAVYALFIAGLFTVFTFVSFTGWIQIIVALVALFFAGVNIKDYFWYKEGISLTISDEKKPGLLRRVRGLVDASQSFWGLASATVVMAAGVSLVEFSCTAGFPMIWTNLLSSQHVALGVFAGLLLVYLIVYQLDELGIFLVAVYSMKATRLEEKHGRILKLVGGVLMLTLGVVMLVKPSLMSDLTNSLIIFGIAIALTLLILLVHRRILPAFGIWVGTEQEAGRRGK